MTSAVVVGGGPNGLTAAALLAKAGLRVTLLEAADETGGGTRSHEAILPGLLHDHCSAIHPLAVTSPALRSLRLERHGLRWRLPEVDCVHPLDDGTAGVLLRSVEETASGLGPDGRRYRALVGPSVRCWDTVAEDVMGPLLRIPSHPLPVARFGLPTAVPAALLARLFRTPRARALWAGVAAHAFRPLSELFSSAIGLGILTAGHAAGWAVAEGGSQAIARGLESALREHGGVVHTGERVTDAAQLPPADVTLLDLDPGQLVRLYGDRLPRRVRAAYRRFRRGPGAFKIDLAVEGGVPWTAEDARRAGTVHLGGPLAEVARAEREVVAGRMPERPFVLVGQQYLADPSRSVGDVHPVWAYAHVPHGYDGDATEAILQQIERFAPGARDRVVGLRVTRPADFAAANANFGGGDILTGAKTVPQLLLGARPALDPYGTGVPGVFLCSAATPPGPGAHGMSGAGAVASALRYLATV
ncbi:MULTISPECIES: phytoene desaturase family protein [unclassified Streptomyces]|uniref:phytoene desaturase family protein n=1 Tax=unclassified Streptomyces TaxID=2593676 RepID=UPI0022B5EA86|nr:MULTISPECIES: NAD(P)/FAD-dependent oxidoreductase [unclassified Streptomyces]MCZ7416060.1 NAD(P)/FAD-dependent oxidoreductase [Streptomyces sp. WMMC897]MCZ7434133.1 NAD(P)/FAD-dependent oxidoreductase [Streptomyces sp. WMMC1477]